MPESRRRSGPPRPRSRRRAPSKSRPPARASPAGPSRASPRRRGGSARGRGPASRADRRGRVERCRRASSRSGGRARRRRPSSGRSRRRVGRRCRRPASRRGSSRRSRARRGRAAAPAPRRAGTSGRRRSRRARGRRRRAATRSPPREGGASGDPSAGLDLADRAEPGPRLRRPPPQLLAPAREGVDHRLHHHLEARHPAALVGREVGAAEERHPVGVEEDGHRPAPVAAHRLHRLHVEGVDVGPLLAVDLDVDEVLVHVGGGGRILEGLALHHVAPVAGGVADGEQDRAVLLARAAPAPPGPRDTSPPGCRGAGAGTGWSPAPGGSASPPGYPRAAPRSLFVVASHRNLGAVSEVAVSRGSRGEKALPSLSGERTIPLSRRAGDRGRAREARSGGPRGHPHGAGRG